MSASVCVSVDADQPRPVGARSTCLRRRQSTAQHHQQRRRRGRRWWTSNSPDGGTCQHAVEQRQRKLVTTESRSRCGLFATCRDGLIGLHSPLAPSIQLPGCHDSSSSSGCRIHSRPCPAPTSTSTIRPVLGESGGRGLGRPDAAGWLVRRATASAGQLLRCQCDSEPSAGRVGSQQQRRSGFRVESRQSVLHQAGGGPSRFVGPLERGPPRGGSSVCAPSTRSPRRRTTSTQTITPAARCSQHSRHGGTQPVREVETKQRWWWRRRLLWDVDATSPLVDIVRPTALYAANWPVETSRRQDLGLAARWTRFQTQQKLTTGPQQRRRPHSNGTAWLEADPTG